MTISASSPPIYTCYTYVFLARNTQTTIMLVTEYGYAGAGFLEIYVFIACKSYITWPPLVPRIHVDV
jgi:hypothetical protein